MIDAILSLLLFSITPSLPVGIPLYLLARKFPVLIYGYVALSGLYVMAIWLNSLLQCWPACADDGAMSTIFHMIQIVLGSVLILSAMLALGFRTKLDALFAYRKKNKLVIALVLTMLVSFVAHWVANPCSGRILCNYFLGFPLPVFLVTDYVSLELLLLTLAGITGNVALWFGLLTIVFHFTGQKNMH